MRNRILSDSLGVWGILLAFSLVAPLASGDDEWTDSEAARTTSDTMDHHMATAGDADDQMATSRDPDSLVVEAKNPDSLLSESIDPDSLVVDSESLDSHRGHTEALQDLDVEAPDRGFEAIDTPPTAIELDPTPSAQGLVAQRKLERAEADAKAARTAYGDMMERNYPRGEARERIVRRRDETMKALEEARSEVEALRP